MVLRPQMIAPPPRGFMESLRGKSVRELLGERGHRPPLLAPASVPMGLMRKKGGGRQTIVVTAREHASSTTDGTTFTTGTFTPTANALQILDIISQRATGEEPTGVTGCGLTWVKVTPSGTNPVILGGGTTRYLTRWRAMGASPSNGALTITFTNTMTSCAWAWNEATGVDTSGTNGSGAFVQTVGVASSGNVTTLGNTLAAFEHANNVHLAVFALNTAATVTPDADFTELGDDNEATAAVTIETQRAVNQLVCDATFSSANAGAISSELKSAAA